MSAQATDLAVANLWARCAAIARRELEATTAGKRDATEQQLDVWRRVIALAEGWGLS